MRRQRDQAGLVFQDAVRLLFEGRFGQAMKKAAEAHGNGTAPGLSALIAARAAQRMREPEKQRYWLEHARTDDPRTEAATLMLDAEMANEERRFADALAALGRLQGKQGRHIAALRLELRARQGTGDWDGVLKLVRQLAKRDALPAEVVREIRTQAHLAGITRRCSDQAQLVAYLRTIPEEERGRRVVLAAARALVATGGDGDAQKLIETALERGDGDDLASGTGRDLWPADRRRANGAHRPRGSLAASASGRCRAAHGPGPHVPAPAAVGQGAELSGGVTVGGAIPGRTS